jgi:hypothetical protein
MFQRSTLSSLLIVLCACALVAAAYWPGTSGPFIFDDAANLPALGSHGPIHDGAAFMRYITGGKGDPTGRPVALLTFLANAQDWPANPLPFKLTNLGIHLLNGVLLWTVLLRLGASYGYSEQKRRFSAALASLLWLAHPLFVSTVLYVIQREAILPATFALLAIHAWLNGRKRLLEGQRHGMTWVVVGVGGFTLLAALSKANGLLIPLLILIAEATMPRPDGDHVQRYRRAWQCTLLPAACVVTGFIAWDAIRSIGSAPIALRGWSPYQRLLTEPGILFDYVAQLWLVRPVDGGVFHDDYPVALGLMTPWYVIPSISLWVMIAVGGWTLRRRAPAAALAILFFLGGHLLESTSIPLELYFEHRNYLPSLPMFWPLALLVARMRRPGFSTAIGSFLIASELVLTWSGARVWGSPLLQAVEWASLHPESPRAQAYAAQVEASYNRPMDALRRIDSAVTRFPDEPQILFNAVELHCLAGRLTAGDLELTAHSLAVTPRDPGALLAQWADAAIDVSVAGACPSLDLAGVELILHAAAGNPAIRAIPGRLQDIDHLRGRIALERSDVAGALILLNAALAREPKPQTALQQAAMLGASGHPEEGLAHLDYYDTLPLATGPSPTAGMPWLNALIVATQGYWPGEIAHLRQTLRSDIHRAPHG